MSPLLLLAPLLKGNLQNDFYTSMFERKRFTLFRPFLPSLLPFSENGETINHRLDFSPPTSRNGLTSCRVSLYKSKVFDRLIKAPFYAALENILGMECATDKTVRRRRIYFLRKRKKKRERGTTTIILLKFISFGEDELVEMKIYREFEFFQCRAFLESSKKREREREKKESSK